MGQRLIDANKLKVDYIVGSTSTNTECYRYISKNQIDSAETIEAIPIEWVENFIKQLSDIVDGYDKASLSYLLSNVKLDTLKDMLKDWEKEDGK